MRRQYTKQLKAIVCAFIIVGAGIVAGFPVISANAYTGGETQNAFEEADSNVNSDGTTTATVIINLPENFAADGQYVDTTIDNANVSAHPDYAGTASSKVISQQTKVIATGAQGAKLHVVTTNTSGVSINGYITLQGNAAKGEEPLGDTGVNVAILLACIAALVAIGGTVAYASRKKNQN